MKKFLLHTFLFLFCFNIEVSSNESIPYNQDVREIFNIGKMISHNKKFTLFFKTRNKAVLAKGQDFNYITDYPQDLYLFNNKTEIAKPLITYDWFPNKARSLIRNYEYPVFPEDYAYYLLNDNETLILISGIKSIRSNFKFDDASIAGLIFAIVPIPYGASQFATVICGLLRHTPNSFSDKMQSSIICLYLGSKIFRGNS